MDTSAIAIIANAAVSLLAPYLKSLGEGLVKKAGEALGAKAGEMACQKAKELHETIKARFSPQPEVAKAMSALEKSPDDNDTQAAVRFHLKGLITADESFARELAGILKEASEAGVDTMFHTTIFGSIQKLVQMGTVYGDVNL